MPTANRSTGAVVELVPRRLTALCNAYAVDGRVSWHARSVRGHASMNCYLLTEGRDALLVDTGVTVHRDVLLEQLREQLPPSARFSILLLRQGEFDSMCNLGPILDAFDVELIHGQYDDAPVWADMHSEPRLRMSGVDVPPTRVPSNPDVIAAGSDGSRQLDILVPELRLLGTYWAYDRDTRTLFTSDSFAYVIRDTPDGPWVVTAEDDDTTPEQVERHLLGTRYWWLDGAYVDGVRKDVAAIFDRFDVERIAPAFGCVLEGRAVVERHVAMTDEILAARGRRTGASR